MMFYITAISLSSADINLAGGSFKKATFRLNRNIYQKKIQKYIQMQLILTYFYMSMFIYKFIVLLYLRIEIQMRSGA